MRAAHGRAPAHLNAAAGADRVVALAKQAAICRGARVRVRERWRRKEKRKAGRAPGQATSEQSTPVAAPAHTQMPFWQSFL